MINFRYWLALCENAAELPEMAKALIGKSKQVKLKDGFIATLQVAENPNLPGIDINATINGEFAGSLDLSPNNLPPLDDGIDLYGEDRGSWSATNVWVNEPYKRKGLATAMYDFATRLGFKILRSGVGYGGKLTPNGSALWQSNRVPLRLGKPLPKQSRFWKVRKKPVIEDVRPKKEVLPKFAQIVANPKFQQWFAGSKIVNRKGTPMPVFHGTLAAFSRFDPDKSNSKSGTGVPRSAFVFSTLPRVAATYAGQHTWMTGSKEWRDGGNLVPVFLNIKKPLTIDARGDDWDNIRFRDDDWDINRIMGYAQRRGYDGLIVRNVLDSGERGDMEDSKATTIVAFSPNQIKSVFSKEFAPTDDISEQA